MTMHQVQLTVWGEPENLHFTETPMPSPFAGMFFSKLPPLVLTYRPYNARKGLGPAASLINLDQEPAVLGWDVCRFGFVKRRAITRDSSQEKVFGLVQFPASG